MTNRFRALGLMSGTSMDGIDVALLETDGQSVLERGPFRSFAYAEDFRARLRLGLTDARHIVERSQRPGSLRALERELTERHAAAVQSFLAAEGIDPGTIDIAAFHGQTVLHKPVVLLDINSAHQQPQPAGTLTVQLGDGPLLARSIGIDVVYDLRAADCAAGGQGAPLAPVYHRALAGKVQDRPVAFLNVGGVANVTWIDGNGRLIAFDTGPGNALIDDWLLRHTGTALDDGGRLAAAGEVDDDLLATMLRDPYFGTLPPKSLDRNRFTLDGMVGVSAADGAATLTAFTAAAVRRSLEHLPEAPRLWIVCGGGRRNRTLMGALAERLEAAVAPVEAIGCDGDAIEAEAWAYLGVRALRGLPLSFPMTTGVPAPVTGGVLAKA